MNEHQNACGAITTAVIRNCLIKEKLGQLFTRDMQVIYCAAKRGQGMRNHLEDMDIKMWIRQPLAVPGHAMEVCDVAHL